MNPTQASRLQQPARGSFRARASAFATTGTLAALVFATAGAGGALHGAAKAHAAAMAARPAEIQQCTGCHGDKLAGRAKFSPSIRRSGVMREYNQAKFAKVMDTGVTPDGTKVHAPMPVFHYKAATSNKLYAYLTSLK